MRLVRRRAAEVAIAAGLASLAATSAYAAYPGANGDLMIFRTGGRGGDLLLLSPGGGRTRPFLRQAGAAVWSADGQRVAYIREAIYVADTRGANATRITRPGTYGHVDFSPDGQRLVFSRIRRSGRAARGSLHVVGAAGGPETRLTNGNDMEPSWSPDGNWIAFTRVRGRSRSDVWIVNADGSGERRITGYRGLTGFSDWSPDGSVIAFSALRRRGGGIFVIAPDGTGQRKVPGTRGTDLGPVWSPDGRRLAFTRALLTGRRASLEVYTTNADGTGRSQRTRNRVDDLVIDWQPLP